MARPHKPRRVRQLHDNRTQTSRRQIQLEPTAPIAAGRYLPIFQRWIQEHTVPGMLIDVIDYKHVLEGPGVVLVADEADYAYDLGEGQPGLHYVRKRDLPDSLPAALRLSFHHAFASRPALEAEAPGDLVFDYRTAKISFLDRMHYRNQPEVFDAFARKSLKSRARYTARRSNSRASTTIRGGSSPCAPRVTVGDINPDDIARRLRDSHQTA